MNLRREASFRWLTIAAVGIAIAVRLFGLDYSLWHDEIASVTFARQPVWRLWSDWMIREPNPPLFYTMLHYWMAWFGSTDLAVKSLATVFGIGNVVVVALIARRLGSSWLPALVATLFVGLNPWHIYYSQNARAYTLAAFAASLAGLAVVRIVKQHHDASSSGGARADWMLFGLAMLAALYSHTTMVIFYVVVNLMFASWIAITTRRERLLAPWIASNLMICIGYGWGAWITWHQLGHNGNLAWMDRLNIRLATHIMLEIFAPQSHYLSVRDRGFGGAAACTRCPDASVGSGPDVALRGRDAALLCRIAGDHHLARADDSMGSAVLRRGLGTCRTTYPPRGRGDRANRRSTCAVGLGLS